MENNNGKGIFYGVIGIATLIVAIIGATFAYFTATYQTSNTAINVTSYSGFSLSLVMKKVAPNAEVNKLIPLDSELYMNSALHHTIKGNNETETTPAPCLDANGDQVCAIYEMTITNNGTDAKIQGFLSSEVNEYTGYNPSNLKYRLYTYGDSNGDSVSEYTALSETVTVPAQGADITSIQKFKYGTDNADTTDINESDTIALAEGASTTLYLVIWLEEYKVEGVSKSQNEDIGKKFTGKVTFNATTGAGGELVAKFD